MKLYSASTIRELEARHDFHLSKSLGQNFLTDKGIIDQIIEGAEISEDDLVIEIGPGIGVLTVEAAQRAKRVVAVEIDQSLIPILKETLAEFDNVEIVNRDILKTDINALIEEHGEGIKGVKIIGNLPYYITTPIVMKILEDGVRADSIIVMMQKEVADRIKSKPSKKTYGALSVAVQYYCTAEAIVDVPRSVFVPQPNVDSTVLKLIVRPERPVELIDEKIFFETVKGGFGQRRKTLSNALSGVCGMDKTAAAQVLAAAEIDPIRRAETLDLNEFARLANEVAKWKDSKK
jgi:16S rRNA (adenine1518-N6/adenine1519-N6)-dimethyltransferase